ncbi:dihydrofolate reductase family protein [Rhodococcus aerolatus]
MTRVVYRTATTLTGQLADPDGSLAWLFEAGEPTGDDHEEFVAGVGVMVEGSTTYEWVLRETDLLARPQQWQDFYGDRPTYVLTTRALPVPAGADVRFVRGPVAAHLDEIRTAAGGLDVWVVGGGDVAGQLLDVGALDEVVVHVAPATLADGAPLLPRRLGPDRLRLVSVAHQGAFARLRYAVLPG